MFKKNIDSLIIPLLNIAIAILITSVLIAAIGVDPLLAYKNILRGAFVGKTNILATIARSTTLIFTGLALLFSLGAGLFNIGAPGQMIVGGLASATFSIYIAPILQLGPYVSLMIGGLFGAGIGALTGILRYKFNINEAISSIMFNYIILEAESYMLTHVIRGAKDASKTDAIPIAQQLPTIHGMSSGFIVAIVVAFIAWFILEKTVIGYEIKAVGYNVVAAFNLGLNLQTIIIMAMSISGFLCGIAGGERVLGNTGAFRYDLGMMADYGFDGMLIALLGKNPFGVVISAFFFGVLREGALKMEIFARTPSEITAIMRGIIILLAASEAFFRRKIFKKKDKSKGRPL